MLRACLVLALLGCHGSVSPPPVVAAQPVPVETPVGVPEAPVGAVPIPADPETRDLSPNLLDRSVRIAELPTPDAAWRERATLRYTGRIAIALHIAHHDLLELTVVDTVTTTESGYPGGLEDFPLGGATEAPQHGNAFDARDTNPTTGEFTGPVMFAVRLLPRTGAPESERRQYVVYTDRRAVFVAEKLVTEARWIPRLRIDAPKASELVAIQPGWH